MNNAYPRLPECRLVADVAALGLDWMSCPWQICPAPWASTGFSSCARALTRTAPPKPLPLNPKPLNPNGQLTSPPPSLVGLPRRSLGGIMTDAAERKLPSTLNFAVCIATPPPPKKKKKHINPYVTLNKEEYLYLFGVLKQLVVNIFVSSMFALQQKLWRAKK